VNNHIGDTFDSFLAEQGILSECSEVALKRVLGWKLEQAMIEQGVTKAELAKRMNTSRTTVSRVLSGNTGVTIRTLSKAAEAANLNLTLGLTQRL